MGMRSLIVIDSDNAQPVTIYAHWGGVLNREIVHTVLQSTSSQGVPEYLAAQMFYEFAKQMDYDGQWGFAISAGNGSEYFIDRPTVFVNADDLTYTYEDQRYNAFGEAIAEYEPA
jgi:hypothetical protein